MATVYQEYLAPQGTLVKPYYWLAFTQGCCKCPYHIRTSEESRVPYAEFYEAFGFPYGPTMPRNKHLLFYELRNISGTLIQKGQATNCTLYNLHPESTLFDLDGYLDSIMDIYDNISYITLYSNYSPCNESNHYCIGKMYDFLISYPSTRLDIYFSQLYHTDEIFPESGWNREALRSLAGLWPRVTISPISGGTWLSVLRKFVNGVPQATLYNPVLPTRAFADKHNAYLIAAITGINPSFVDVAPQAVNLNPMLQAKEQTRNPFPQPSFLVMNATMPSPVHFIPFSTMYMPMWGQHPIPTQNMKPKNIVRHLNMPQDYGKETPRLQLPPNARPVQVIEITERPVKKRDKDIDSQNRKISKS
uniref:Apolipoprotein B mRNA editing enzyme catalytic polypeptide like 4 n=2 Tax=Latimeria chalumnae TaxID=7897 RepID=H3B3J0_LATCH